MPLADVGNAVVTERRENFNPCGAFDSIGEQHQPVVILCELGVSSVDDDALGRAAHPARLQLPVVVVRTLELKRDPVLPGTGNQLPGDIPAPVADGGEVEVAMLALVAPVGDVCQGRPPDRRCAQTLSITAKAKTRTTGVRILHLVDCDREVVLVESRNGTSHGTISGIRIAAVKRSFAAKRFLVVVAIEGHR